MVGSCIMRSKAMMPEAATLFTIVSVAMGN